ncbi:4-(cytidine 5'-diphospho)-2-C-methyl-D-erythritol kinase [Acuticoccus sp. MNP-M23]|uniref:4-(cytidine 5'-diphospho)-2-C-methyl-D-erythritol kinase n=1 Tax=Acuticoccus sp. MNP-M23 TaxID=3072793 RepID=UPI002816001F|nr:4-(cytidine 5'-diphospho)-2-C-methyl-D-erythritol kinase [Acuticoccus sp. MNP-M23]WMS43619.1 4-(cytidine 5'-diphospho)-2-C-methyl-D-erythritol kinase [Acuticoccus sp. MNP-M23]
MNPGAGAASVTVTARAKINLALHVIGQRGDGYHLLDSLVAFASLGAAAGSDAAPPLTGDRLTITFGTADGPPRLTVDGPFAGAVPAGSGNSVLAAAAVAAGISAIHLTKALPVAAGIGGGSADAAAVLQAVANHRGIPRDRLNGVALSLGADVPVCLRGEPARMQGIGETLTPLALPSLPCVLVNPGISVSTPDVFRALTSKANPALPAGAPPAGAEALAAFLARQRNDLEAPAIALAPEIGAALDVLRRQAGCTLARMSGSGGTIFGLFADDDARTEAVAALRAHAAKHVLPWWIEPARLEGSDGAPHP